MLEQFENYEIDVYETEEFCPICRGQIRYVDFGEVDPSTKELGKCRPAIVFQGDEYNVLNDSTVWVVPLSKSPMYTCYTDGLVAVRIHGNGYPSILCTNSIKMVQKDKIREYICKCPKEVMDYIERYIAKRACIQQSAAIDTDLPGDKLAENPLYKKCVIEADKMKYSEVSINPEWIRAQSIAFCKNFVCIVDVLGIDYFNDTPKFNAKTFQAAYKTAKMRSGMVIPLLQEECG